MHDTALDALQERHLVGQGQCQEGRRGPGHGRATHGDLVQRISQRVEVHEGGLEERSQSNGTLRVITVDDQQVKVSSVQGFCGTVREQSIAELEPRIN